MQRYRESLINDASFPFFRWLRNTRFHFRNGNENNRSLPILSRSFGFLRFRRHRLCKRSSLRATYRCLRDFQGELKIERNFIFPFFILTDARSTSRCSEVCTLILCSRFQQTKVKGIRAKRSGTSVPSSVVVSSNKYTTVRRKFRDIRVYSRGTVIKSRNIRAMTRELRNGVTFTQVV